MLLDKSIDNYCDQDINLTGKQLKEFVETQKLILDTFTDQIQRESRENLTDNIDEATIAKVISKLLEIDPQLAKELNIELLKN